MTANGKGNNEPTLVEPFIFNHVSHDIKKKIQDNIASRPHFKTILDHMLFIDNLLSVRFNEHASMNKAANLETAKSIQGYHILFSRLEEEMPHLFEVENGYIIAQTEAGEAYFEGQAYQDIENVVSCVRTHLQNLEEEFRDSSTKNNEGAQYKNLEEALKSLQRYAHAKAGIALDRCPDFKPKRDVDYSIV